MHEIFIEEKTRKGRIHLVMAKWKEHNFSCKERRKLPRSCSQAAWSEAVPCLLVLCHEKRSHGW